jgi:hypothetical protein
VIDRAGGPPENETPQGPEQFDADGALSREFLLARGHCCSERCRNCPYGFSPAAEQADRRDREQR